MEAILQGDRLCRELLGNDPVSGGDGIRVLEVYLMLACRDFVVGHLNLKAHLGQREHDLSSDILSSVIRRKIEIRPGVRELRRRLSIDDG